MYYRNIIQQLEEWSIKPNRKPMVLQGAGQAGKTMIVEYFAENTIVSFILTYACWDLGSASFKPTVFSIPANKLNSCVLLNSQDIKP